MSKIIRIEARQILDSRGYPTLEAEVTIRGKGQWKQMGRAAVPSGASTGSREAWELRDGDQGYYLGKSVRKAVENVNGPLAQALKGQEVTEQKKIDKLMIALDGTENKTRLGANAILAVSMAVARAGALDRGLPLYRYLREVLSFPHPPHSPHRPHQYHLPIPLMNIINGGQHASNNLDIQEFMIVPHLNKKAEKESFGENLRAGAEIFHHLKAILKKKGHSTNVGDEGGFAPHLSSHEEALELILEAIDKAKYRPEEEVSLALDAAASEFYTSPETYSMQGQTYDSEQMIEYYSNLSRKFPLYSLEDGLSESDYEGWRKLTARLGGQLAIVGDDLFVTNRKILTEGIEKKWANAILIKPNQIGTLSETAQTLAMAFDHGFRAIISHRSGETGDSFIADLAVASGSGFIKTGSLARSDRIEKYNQLLRIEEDLAESL